MRHTNGDKKNVNSHAMKKLFCLCILLTAGSLWPAVGQSRWASKRTMRLYKYVQQYDNQSGQWRDIHARARLECDSLRTRITLWNHWGDERINPLFRVWATGGPMFDTSSEQWKLSARMRRAKGSHARDCTIESNAMIALDSHVEFLLRTSDYSVRYRISKQPILEDDEY